MPPKPPAKAQEGRREGEAVDATAMGITLYGYKVAGSVGLVGLEPTLSRT